MKMEIPPIVEREDPWQGPNAKLLAVRVPEKLYAALERAAEDEGIALPLLVRSCLYFFFAPAVFRRTIHDLKGQPASEEVLGELEFWQLGLSDKRVSLERILSAIEDLNAIERYAVGLREKFDDIEKELSDLWSRFENEINDQCKSEDSERGLSEQEGPEKGEVV